MSTDFEKKKLKEYLGEDLYDMLKRYKCIVAGAYYKFVLWYNVDIEK